MSREVGLGNADLEHEEGDGDGKDAVAERLDPCRLRRSADWGLGHARILTRPVFHSGRLLLTEPGVGYRFKAE
jgi:hypothetical protein